MADKKPSYYARAKGTAERGQQWVERQDPASSPGVTIGWFRRYAAADGQLYAVLLTAYLFLTVLPAALVIDSYLETDPNALANHVIDRLGLKGATEDLFRSVLQGAGGHKLTASLIALGSVAFFGLGIGRVLQLAHAKAWGLDLRKARIMDQARYLQVLLAILLAILLYAIQGKVLEGEASWIGWVIAPFWALRGLRLLRLGAAPSAAQGDRPARRRPGRGVHAARARLRAAPLPLPPRQLARVVREVLRRARDRDGALLLGHDPRHDPRSSPPRSRPRSPAGGSFGESGRPRARPPRGI